MFLLLDVASLVFIGLSISAFAPLALFPFASATLVNITIDDTFGDPSTGAQIVYDPPGIWKVGQNCSDCTTRPDPSQLHNGTWHDGTFEVTGENGGFSNQLLLAAAPFNGVAVYVYCVVTHSFKSDMSFFLDGFFVGEFKQPQTGDTTYDYNVPVYANTSIPPGNHTIVIVTGQRDGNQTLTLLDYIVYTRDISSGTSGQSAPSLTTSSAGTVSTNSKSVSSTSLTVMTSTSSTSAHNHTAIIAAVSSIGGVLVIVAIAGIIYYYRRRSARKTPSDGVFPTDAAPIDEEDPGTSGWVEGTWTGDDESPAPSSTGRRAASTAKRKRGPSNASNPVTSPPTPPTKFLSVKSPALPVSAVSGIQTFLLPSSRSRPEPVSPSSSFGNLGSPPPDSATFLLSPFAPPPPPLPQSRYTSDTDTFLDMDQSYADTGMTTLASHNAHPFAKSYVAVHSPDAPYRQRHENTNSGTLDGGPNASSSSLSAARRGPDHQDHVPSKKTSGSDLASRTAPSPPLTANPVSSGTTTPTSTTMLVPKRKASPGGRELPSAYARANASTTRRVDPVDPAMQPSRDALPGRASRERERERAARTRDRDPERRRGQVPAQVPSRDGQARAQGQAEHASEGVQGPTRNRSGRRAGMLLSERDQKRFGFLDVPIDASDSRPPSYREGG